MTVRVRLQRQSARLVSARFCVVALAIALASATATLCAESVSPAADQAAAAPAWSFAGSVYHYFLPGEDDITSPIVRADHGAMHLEARYNYEAERAGSAFFGWTFSMGDTVAVDVTPMLGGVFGDLSAVAPGVEFNLDWKHLNVYYEGEYVIDLGDDDGDFVYGWTEATWAPADWVRVGVVGQRTRLYDTGLDVQRGPMVGFTFGRFDVAGYFFNPGSDDSLEAVSLSVEF
jgi:hypothetical protein